MPKHVRSGKLRALAVGTPTRSEAVPDLPSIAELVPGYAASGLGGIGAPRNTPALIVDRLNGEINAGLAEPKMRARLADLGYTAVAGSPVEYVKLVADEIDQWGKVIEVAGAKPE